MQQLPTPAGPFESVFWTSSVQAFFFFLLGLPQLDHPANSLANSQQAQPRLLKRQLSLLAARQHSLPWQVTGRFAAPVHRATLHPAFAAAGAGFVVLSLFIWP